MGASERATCDFERDKLIIRLDMNLRAEPGAIDPVVDRVLEMVRQMKCASGKEFEIETALREALANAIRHGCGSDPTKTIRCCVACDESRGMMIVVSDPGQGFDPATVPSPIVGRQLYSDHGRGLFLINRLMDEVSIEGGGTIIRMRKN